MREMAQVAAGHIDWRKWVNGRVIDSLDADMEGGDFLRKGEALELAELLVRAEAKLYTDSQVGEGGEQTGVAAPLSVPSREPATPDAHGNASRNDETKPQQSPASDEDLDKIIAEAQQARGMDIGFDAIIRRACLRARASEQREVTGLRSKLAAVRAWRDQEAWSYDEPRWGKLDAILDGKEADHE